MNNKNFFQDDEKYKALEKEQKKFSKPKESQEYNKSEEIESKSENEIYEGLDNINSFTKEKQNKAKNFLLRIFLFQVFLNFFSKFIIKLLLICLENSLIKHKFFGKFSAKIQKILMKLFLAIQLKILLLQFFSLLRNKLQAKILEKSFIKENLNNIKFIQEKQFDLNPESHILKSLNINDIRITEQKLEKSFNFQNIENYKFGNFKEIQSENKNFQKETFHLEKLEEKFNQRLHHGGRDFHFFNQNLKGQVSTNTLQQDNKLFDFLFKIVSKIASGAKDFILNYGYNNDFSITSSERIAPEKVSATPIKYSIEIDSISSQKHDKVLNFKIESSKQEEYNKGSDYLSRV